MSRLRTLSGEDVIKIFGRFGFQLVSQRGSHVKLQRIGKNDGKQTLVIPRHAELDKGTVGAIYRQGLQYVPEDELRQYFFE